MTNWHCLTGINPESMKPIGTYTPNKCRIEFTTLAEHTENKDFRVPKRMQADMNLLDGEEANWIEHSDGPEVDICLFPLGRLETRVGELKCLNDLSLTDSFDPSVSSDCFIIGYPQGISGASGTPIWKRGSIATEPQLNHDGKPTLLVDSLTNPGMSGSPFIIKSQGLVHNTASGAVLGQLRQLLGVYSGRIGDDGVGFQLGRVWKAFLIDEILSNPRKGVVPSV